ncbi:programmed cell death protein 6-like [Haliotis rufescens]|uniref:programmed cell death protein 6-like n=1 Tax=Haliotis rufescens TaxID=6454 RepID=UPI001EB022E2|nr:programmed cell death protein 6-like [Haliotis rufescens]
MSWGGPPQQGYGGYGTGAGYYQQQPQQSPQYSQPGQYNQAYGQPPQQQYGQPPQQQYGQQQQQFDQQYGGGYQQRPGGAPPSYGAPQGYGAPQTAGYGRGYGAPAPPPGISQEMWSWFQAVDQDRSGTINSKELQQALMNGNWSPFNSETCRLMIGMFDKDRSGTIDVGEFSALWKYIQDWKNCFDGFDTDRSGNIDAQELSNAFRTFGYNLSPSFCDMVIRVFDRKGIRSINFDDFIQTCVMLKTLTDKFRVKDTQQQGIININYEEFLEMVLDNTLLRLN